MKLRTYISVAIFPFFMMACNSDNSSNDSSKNTNKDSNKVTLQEKTWNEIKPDGTVCSDGSPYMFFAMPGSKNNLVIDFQGGGACWSNGTCNAQTRTFDPTVSVADDKPKPYGIYNRKQAKNPVKDWNHVFAPYCTADVHVGNNVAKYNNADGSSYDINHKGAVNARKVLNWTYKQFPNPETVFVTGCSAGAYGSIFYVPDIKKNYPNAKVVQMGDCGAGVGTDDFIKTISKQWNISAFLPSDIETLNPNNPKFKFDSNFFKGVYKGIGKKFPDTQLSQFNTSTDGVQIGFYALGKGEKPPTQQSIKEWITGFQSSIGAITQSTSNFASYTSNFDDNSNPQDGSAHCIIQRPEFYTVTENGTSLSDWVTDLVNGKAVNSIQPKSK